MNNVISFSPGRLGRAAWLLFACLLSFAAGAQTEKAAATSYSEVMPLAHKSLLLDVARAGNTLVAVGERGHVLTSTDNGKSWTQSAKVPTRATLTAVYAIGKHMWAVGHDTTIIHSADGGQSWELQFSDPPREVPLLDIYFSDATTGFAIGAYGTLLTTTDGGKHWHDGLLLEDDDFHLNAIIPLEANQLFVVAEGGTAYRSDDGGQNWQRLHLPYAGSMFGALYLSERIVAFGLRGHVFVSPDQGQSWQLLESPVQSSLFGGTILGANSALLVGANGAVLLLNGDTLQSRGQPLGGEDLAAVLALTNQRLVVVGEGGIHLLNLSANQAN